VTKRRQVCAIPTITIPARTRSDLEFPVHLTRFEHAAWYQVNSRLRTSPQRDEAKAKAAEDALQAPLRVLDAQLAGREYILGDRFGVVDLNVASTLAWTRFGKIDLSPVPNVAAWLPRCSARPALKAAKSK
jgi:glutathione S-transferase